MSLRCSLTPALPLRTAAGGLAPHRLPMPTPAYTPRIAPAQPAGRAPQRDPLDDPGIPCVVRWCVRLASYALHASVLRRSAPIMTAATMVPLAADHEWRIAPPLLSYMAAAERALVARGFAPPFRAVNAATATLRSFVSLVEHPGESTLGFVLVSEGEHNAPHALATFRTDFVDGIELVTTNAHTVLRTPPRPGVLGVRVREVHDVSDLHDLHRFRVAERARRFPVAPLTRGAHPIAFEEGEARATYEFWIRVGYYEQAGAAALRLTRRGACLAAWRGLFPWAQLTVLQEDHAAAAVRRRYAARVA